MTVLGESVYIKVMPDNGPPVIVLMSAIDERMALTLLNDVVLNDQTPPTRLTPSIKTESAPRILHLSCS